MKPVSMPISTARKRAMLIELIILIVLVLAVVLLMRPPRQ